MANNLEYAQIFQEGLDLVLEQEPVTNWMTADNDRVQYNGGNEYKFATLDMDELSDYDRNTGFVDGDVSLTWETKKFEYDRGRKFSLDAMDTDETHFEATAGNVMGEFARTKVTPEVDLTRIARLASSALPANVVAITDETKSLEDFKAGIVAIREAGYSGQLIAHVTYDFMNKLELRMANQLGSETFSINGVDTTFRSIDKVALIPTVSTRMFKAVTKNSGTKVIAGTPGQEIEFVISGISVPHAIAKHESVRVFSPEVNQDKNAWQLDYRLYHDTIVLKNGKPAIYVATPKVGE